MSVKESMTAGAADINNKPLVDKNKIILSAFYIKMGLIEQFVKALKKEGDCFKYM